MASAKRAILERALKQDWVPELQANGFGGRPWKFLRERQDFVDRVVLEFDRSGDGCRILLGVEPQNFPSATRQEVPDFQKLPVTLYQFQKYVTTEKGDWFRFGELSDDDLLIFTEVIIDRFDEVSQLFFREYENLDCLRRFSPADLADNDDLMSRFRREPRKAAVFFCKMYRYLGQAERAKAFAEAGLKSKVGVFGEQFMKEVIQSS